MGARRRLLLLALALSALPILERPAVAFVRSVTTDTPHNPLYWSTSCETVTIYLNGFSDMTVDEVVKSIGAAAAAWGPDQVTCPSATGDGGNGHPFFQIIPQLSTGGAAPSVQHSDGKNSITFVTTGWGVNGEPPEALAATTVYKEPSGKIVEADIEINATDSTLIAWANLDPGSPPPKNGIVPFDLQVVMTHEFGHFLGLAHTCFSSLAGDIGDGPATTPDCNVATASDLQAVMYPIIAVGVTTNRVLSADDARGVCAIYPATADPHSCTENTPDDGCGCATAGRGLGSDVATLLPALGLLLARRRRPRRR